MITHPLKAFHMFQDPFLSIQLFGGAVACASSNQYAKQSKLHKEHVTGDFTSYWCYRHWMFADHCSTRAGAFRRRSWFHLFLFLRSSCADGGGPFFPARRSSKSSRFAIDCVFFLGKGSLKNIRDLPVWTLSFQMGKTHLLSENQTKMENQKVINNGGPVGAKSIAFCRAVMASSTVGTAQQGGTAGCDQQHVVFRW